MCLQPPWHVMKDTLVSDLTRGHLSHTWYVLNPVGHFVPHSEEFVSGCILGRFYGMVINDQWIEFNHFFVVLE